MENQTNEIIPSVSIKLDLNELLESLSKNKTISKFAKATHPIADMAYNLTSIISMPSKLAKEWVEKRFNIMVDNIKSKNITNPRKISLKIADPLIKNALMEDDPVSIKKWDNLISNAVNADFKYEIKLVYIDILKNMTSIDIHILDTIYDTLLSKDLIYPIENLHKHTLTKENLINVLRISIEDYYISADNLMRSQLIKPAILKDTGIAAGSEPITIYKDVDIITLSPLGAKLVEACK